MSLLPEFKFFVMPLYCLTKEEAVICDKKSISYNFLYISDLFPTGYCTKERLTVTRSKIMGQMSHPRTGYNSELKLLLPYKSLLYLKYILKKISSLSEPR